jgi:hypothetical protein
MSIIIKDTSYEIPGVKTISWKDSEGQALKVKEVTDKNPRTTWIRGIVCHTVHGKLGKLLPGVGPNTNMDVTYAKYQTNTDRSVSWDYTCDLNGDWLVQNDPAKNYTWHAGAVNQITCGFELVQLDSGDLYEGQIAKAVEFIDFLTAKLGIQRQIPWDKTLDRPKRGIVQRIAGPGAGRDVVGIYNHHHQTTNRGLGDPGPWLPLALRDAGYELFDYDAGEDLKAWKERQINVLGLSGAQADGIPGPGTVGLLKTKGYKHGLWIPRPMDSLL